MLQGFAKACVESESDGFLVRPDVGGLQGQDGGLNFLVIGDLGLVAGTGEERVTVIRDVDAERDADGGWENAIVRAGVDSGIRNHVSLTVGEEQRDDWTVEGCPIGKRCVGFDAQV